MLRQNLLGQTRYKQLPRHEEGGDTKKGNAFHDEETHVTGRQHRQDVDKQCRGKQEQRMDGQVMPEQRQEPCAWRDRFEQARRPDPSCKHRQQVDDSKQVQRERFFNEEDYIRLKDTYILTADKMKLAKEDMAVLHPLPRVNEIALPVDDDPRAAYFEQAHNGVFVRMALIMTLLGLADKEV